MTTIARAEFRVFGPRIIDIVQSHMWNGRTVLNEIRTMPVETYVLSRVSAHANVKIRDSVLDIKVRIGDTFEGYQIFEPAGKWPFPLTAAHLAAVEGFLGVSIAGPDPQEVPFDEFMRRVRSHPQLAAVTVEKERFGFSLDGTICEYARVYFNGAMVESACVESAQYEAITSVVQALGLSRLPNTNYIDAASRIVGIVRAS
jgi:hypothetical protein